MVPLNRQMFPLAPSTLAIARSNNPPLFYGAFKAVVDARMFLHFSCHHNQLVVSGGDCSKNERSEPILTAKMTFALAKSANISLAPSALAMIWPTSFEWMYVCERTLLRSSLFSTTMGLWFRVIIVQKIT